MSKAEIGRFSKAVKADKVLADKVKSFGADIDGLVGYANAQGYNFNKDELLAEAKAKKGQLTEEQLDRAAGGGAVVAAEVATVVVAAT